MNNRLEHVDTVRGISMLAMILIHTNAYFLHDRTANALWNACQFAVPAFVFCSSYLFYRKESHSHVAHTFRYYRKRIIRLLVPYYVFLGAYCGLLAVFEPEALTIGFITRSALLTGGIDLNWMVALFLLISLALPALMWLVRNHRFGFIMYALAASASASLLLMFQSPVNFRFVMIVPWSLIILASWVVARHERSKKSLFVIAAFWMVIYLLSREVLVWTGKSLVQFDNKYPPNLFHLSYGLAGTVSLLITSGVWDYFRPVKNVIHYLSVHSYAVFFIHFYLIFISLYTLPVRTIGWIPFFFGILTGTIVIHSSYLRAVTFFRR